MKELLGVRIDNLNDKKINAFLEKSVISKKFHMVTPINPLMLVKSRKIPKFKSVLNRSELNTCDGAGISMMFKLVSRKIERVPGSTLIYDVLNFAEKNNKKVFFLGAQPEINKRLLNVVKQKYPNLITAGYSPAYKKRKWYGFLPGEQKKILSLIGDFKPDILCIFFRGTCTRDLA